MEKKPKQKSITFTLKGINPKAIEERYGISIESNIRDHVAPQFTTPIDGLSINSSDNKLYTFLDESKRQHRCVCTMVDTQHARLPTKTSNCCFWCRNSFTTMPIGVPMEYVHSQTIKKYYSEITKDYYEIRENISSSKREYLEKNKKDNDDDNNNNDITVDICKNEYYITDGLFCSFNCALAFINDNESNPEYNLSKSLLIKMYEDLFKTECNIFAAPHWRLLQQYGGHLSIDEYREHFNKIEYIDLQNRFVEPPQFFNSSKIYEQKIKF